MGLPTGVVVGMKTHGRLLLWMMASAVIMGSPRVQAAEAGRFNVLFIAVDDLRPQLGCYGNTTIQSPNIDKLASRGMLFERAYCQQAICMSSRASLLSGYRPDKGGITNNGPLFTSVPDALTLNQHFINHGYEAVAMGKIYHHQSDYETGWSKKVFQPKGKCVGRGYLDPESCRIAKEFDRQNPNSERKGLGPAFEGPDVPDNAYPDGLVAEHAVQELRRLKDKRFFMAVGFVKPHLPFNAPKKYWDLYRAEDLPLAANPFAPKGMPSQAATSWGELRSYHGIPKKGPVPDELARKLVHGYHAATSYADAQIGMVLDELDALGLTDKTVIILWGDHGWKLGEHGMWCKHTNFEVDTRVPLILSAPGAKARGGKSKALVELVDMYPTLVDLCGLPLPAHLEGTSMAPLLDDPAKPWKKAAFSQYPGGGAMGYSIRTDRYRYTEWKERKSNKVVARQLFDLQVDAAENTNIAGNEESAKVVADLSAMLEKGYQAAKP